MIVETGGFNQNSNYFIGVLPNGEKKKYCLESDWREEYQEMESRLKEEHKPYDDES